MNNKLQLIDIRQATLFAYQLPLQQPMQFKHYLLPARQGLILQTVDSNHQQQFVEMAPLPGFSHDNLAQVTQELIPLLSASLPQLGKQQVTCQSIQFALHALQLPAAKAKPISVENDNVVLLQGDSRQVSTQYMAFNKPDKVKLKVGRGNVVQDIRSFQALCALSPKLQIRCDANQAWNEQQAAQFLQQIDASRLEYIEEPTSDHTLNLQLATRYQIAIALDETLQCKTFHYHHHPAIKALIIKPTIIGDSCKITRLVDSAAKHAMTVSFSSSFESVVGLQQIIALANYHQQRLPNLEISLGIDTLKYFQGSLLQQHENIQQDCHQLEVLWSSN